MNISRFKKSLIRNQNEIGVRYMHKTRAQAWLIASLLIMSDCATLFGFISTVMKYVALCYFVFKSLLRQSKKELKKEALLLAIVGFSMLVIETPFQSGNFSKIPSIGLYALVLIASLFAGQIIDDDNDLVKCVTVCTILVCILMVMSIPMIREQINFFRTYYGGRIRVKGCFSNENSLGHICAMLGVLGVSAIIRLKRQSKPVLMMICCISNLLLCIASGSRTALITFLAFLLICLYFNLRKKLIIQAHRIMLDFISGIVVLIIIYEVIPIAVESFNESGRLGEIKGSVEALWGVGYASSEQIGAITSVAGGHTEMLFISLYYRVGILGMMAYLIIFVSSFISREKYDYVSFAVLIFLVLQMVGESYISSVMSFVSFFDWVILSGLHINSKNENYVTCCNSVC